MAAKSRLNEEALAKKVLRDSTHLRERQSELRQAHISRLHEGLRETRETSTLHFDLLELLVRIDELVATMAKVVVRESEVEQRAEP